MIKHVYISCSLYQKKVQHEMAKIMSWFFVCIFALVCLNNLETPIYKYKEFRGSTKIACLINHGKLTIQEFFLCVRKKPLVHKD